MAEQQLFVSAGGYDANDILSIDCLLNRDLTDSFVVSESRTGRAISIRSEKYRSNGQGCAVYSSEIDPGEIFSIQSNPEYGKTFTAEGAQSRFYKINQKLIYFVNISIDLFREIVCTVVRTMVKLFAEMKGKQFKRKVYALRLLRL